jgi:hypothetical protein
MENIKIGYFSSMQIDDQFIGGIMITDRKSIPLEFKYTEPIKPTKIHKIIFGKVLEKYINEEVIKKNLLKDIKSRVSIFFISEPQLLSTENMGDTPIILLQNTNLPGLKNAGEIQRTKDKEFLVQPSTSKTPLKLIFASPEADVHEKAINMLKDLIVKTDIFEPFLRVETALKSLCQIKS